MEHARIFQNVLFEVANWNLKDEFKVAKSDLKEVRVYHKSMTHPPIAIHKSI